LRSIKKIARGFVSDDVKIMDVTSVVLESDIYYSDVTYFNEFVVDYSDGYNHTNTNEFVAKVMDAYELAAEQVPDGEMNNFTSTLQAQAKLSPSEAVRSSLVNATIGLPPDYTRPFTLADGPTNHTEFMELVTPNPNPYTDFCKAGCTYFFSEVVTTEEPTKLSNCTAKCDFTYRSAAHIVSLMRDRLRLPALACACLLSPALACARLKRRSPNMLARLIHHARSPNTRTLASRADRRLLRHRRDGAPGVPRRVPDRTEALPARVQVLPGRHVP
jgi:hypothetical protein